MPFCPSSLLISPVWNINMMAGAAATVLTLCDFEDGSHTPRLVGRERQEESGTVVTPWRHMLDQLPIRYVSHSFSMVCKFLPEQFWAHRTHQKLENQT